MHSIYELLNYGPFNTSQEGDKLFDRAMEEEIGFQASNSVFYSRFLSASGWKLGNPIEQVPLLPVSAFKHQFEQTRIEGLDGFVLSSSGTGGFPSSISVDNESSRRQKLSLLRIMDNFLGTEKFQGLVFDVNPASASSVSARQAAVMGYSRLVSEVAYLIDENESLAGPPLVIQEKSFDPGAPVLVIGFTYLIWQFLRDISSSMPLPPGSIVLHIGGWKMLEMQRVSKETFDRRVASFFGIPTGSIRNAYGFTELMGVTFMECEFGRKHAPNWVRVTTHRAGDLHVQNHGEIGMLGFRSPLPHSYLGIGLLTDDLGRVSDRFLTCECGREGQTIEIIGRRNKAEVRGCGDILGSSLRGGKTAVNKPVTSRIQELFPHNQTLDPPELARRLESLKHSAPILQSFSTAEKLAFLDQLRREWARLADADESGFLRQNGLGFLIEWSSPSRLRQTLDRSILGGRGSLDQWTSFGNNSVSRIRSLPRGLVGQWVSGNVPALGLFPVIYSWLTNNPSVSRLSSSATGLMPKLLEPLTRLENSYGLGKALLDSTMVVGFDRQNEEANTLISESAETRIIWGGSEAVEVISNLPSKPTAKTLRFGPRTSIAVVFESQLSTPQRLKVVARRLVADVVVFEQAACASPHSIFLIGQDSELEAKLREALAQEFKLAHVAGQIQLREEDVDLRTEIEIYRLRRSLDAEVHRVGELATLVTPGAYNFLQAPVFGRTLHLARLQEVSEIAKFAHPELQTVSVLGNASESVGVANVLAPLGAKRFPIVGRATNFEDPWDGESILGTLIRSVSLGGPD